MIKRLSISLILIGLFLTACLPVRGSGNVISEDRPVSGFNGVSAHNSIVVLLNQEDETSVVVEAEDNIVPLIETEVVDGVLIVDVAGGRSLNNSEPVRVIVGIVDVSSLDATDTGEVIADNLTTDAIDMTVSGHGYIKIETLEAESLAADIDDSGSIDIAGGCTKMLALDS